MARLPAGKLTANEKAILFWVDLYGPGKIAAEFYLGPLPGNLRATGAMPLLWRFPKCLDPSSGTKTYDSTPIARLVKHRLLKYCQPSYPKEFGYARGVQITDLGKERLHAG